MKNELYYFLFLAKSNFHSVCVFIIYIMLDISSHASFSLSRSRTHTRKFANISRFTQHAARSGGYEEQVCVCASERCSTNSKFTTLYNWLCTRENMLANLWARARCISRPDSAHRGWNANSVRRSITI
jgi:hypothetical protein